jgi:flagellar hook-length control protein FliK
VTDPVVKTVIDAISQPVVTLPEAPHVTDRDLPPRVSGEAQHAPVPSAPHPGHAAPHDEADASARRSDPIDPKTQPASFPGQPATPAHLAAPSTGTVASRPATAMPATPSAPARPDAAPIKTGTERVTIKLPDADGGSTTVRIAVRGDQVKATIVSSDSASADQLSRQAPELERALAARGFRETDITVSRPPTSAATTAGGTEGSLAAASLSSGNGEALQSNKRHADGSAGESRQGSADRDRESPDRKAEDQPRQGRPHQRPRHGRGR